LWKSSFSLNYLSGFDLQRYKIDDLLKSVQCSERASDRSPGCSAAKPGESGSAIIIAE